jgi:hypothetical protein
MRGVHLVSFYPLKHLILLILWQFYSFYLAGGDIALWKIILISSFWALFQVLTSHLYIFLYELSIQVFCSAFYWLLNYYCVIRNLYIFLAQILYQIFVLLRFWNVFSFLKLCVLKGKFLLLINFNIGIFSFIVYLFESYFSLSKSQCFTPTWFLDNLLLLIMMWGFWFTLIFVFVFRNLTMI